MRVAIANQGYGEKNRQEKIMRKTKVSNVTYLPQSELDSVQTYERLYEKGLISAKTLAHVAGFDYQKEMEEKEKESKSWAALFPKTNAYDKLNLDKMENDMMLVKIENARRNAEVMSKVLPTVKDDTVLFELVRKTLLNNIEIMNSLKED
jgi:hypothetical protein